MADRYWVGGTWNWDASTTTNWSTSTWGAGGASVPTSSDNVIFDSLSNATAYTVTITATANCADFTMAWPLVWAVTWAWSSALNIYGSMNLSGGTAGITRTYTGAMTFKSTTTGKTITINGITLASSTTFDWVGGWWTLQDNWNNGTSAIIVTRWSIDFNGKTITLQWLSSSNSNTRSITFWSATVNDSGQVNFTTTTGLTFSAGSATFNLSISSSNALIPGWLTFGTVNLTGDDSWIGWDWTFWSLSMIWNAVKTGIFQLWWNITITGTLTITGNSAINRIIVKSSVRGTARTITAAAISVDKVDFQDITGAGAASWDMSAAAWYTGDCGWNSMKALGSAAFTTAATCNWSSGSTWSTATWSNHSIPLPQDTATFTTAGTVTITQDMPRIWSVDFSTVSGAKTWTTSTACSVFGSINLTNLTTLTASTQDYTFEGRWSNTLNSAWFTWAKRLLLVAPWGTLTMSSALVITNNNWLSITSGTFNANNFNITTPIVNSNVSTTRTITMGSWTWELTRLTSTVWTTQTTTWLTVNANTSTIKLTWALTWVVLFSWWAWIVYNNIWVATTNAFATTIQDNVTFSDIKINAWRTVQFWTWSTITTTTFTATWTSWNEITITSDSTWTHALVKSWGGTISCDYLNIQHSVATPWSTWYAGVNSTNNQAVATAGSGWIFTTPPWWISTWWLLMFF